MPDANRQEDVLNRIPLGAIAALAVAVFVGALVLLAQPDAAGAQSHGGTRSFQQTWAAPGSELQVTITASNYGAFGQVVEELPDGFTFVGSSLEDANIEVAGQIIRFNLLGETRFIYRVNVPTLEGRYSFSGLVKNIDREERTIGGHTTLRVGQRPTPTPEPTATPTPEPTATPTPEPTATPTPAPTATPTATPTPEPTATPTPEPTATPTPEPTATPTPEPTATPAPEPTATPTPEPTAMPAPAATATPEPTAVPAQSPTPVSVAETSEAEEGLPVWLWVVPFIAVVGLLLAVYVFVRRRR